MLTDTQLLRQTDGLTLNISIDHSPRPAPPRFYKVWLGRNKGVIELDTFYTRFFPTRKPKQGNIYPLLVSR